MINFHEKIQFKRCLTSSIDCLISQSLKDSEFDEKLKQLVKTIFPSADLYLMSVVSNYAKSMKALNAYENILDKTISKYCEVSDDKAE